MNVDVVLQGGGVLGIGYVGVFKALSEKGYKVERCAGTSAGSVVAALIMAGYNYKELEDIIKNTDFNIFMEKTSLSKFFTIGKLLSAMINKGIYNGEVIEAWMNGLLEKKGVTKFKHLMQQGKSRLKIIASDITGRKIMILPDDIKKYGIDPMEFSIAKAVRMSCSIPFYFTPVLLNNNGKTNFIVDGGLLSNFPIWIFDVEGLPRWPTFGVKIKDDESYSARGKSDILEYLMDIISAALNYDSDSYVREKDNVRTITLDFKNKISATDFVKANKFVDYLCNNGYESTCEFVENWNFNKYIRQYRSGI